MLCFIALIPLTVKVADNVTSDLSITDDWETSMAWMRENTPDPFSNPNTYYEASYSLAEFPEYGVLCWWDYGNFVTEIAHRVPAASPGQQFVGIASPFYLAQTDEEAMMRLRKYDNIRYVIVTYEMVNTDSNDTICPAIADYEGYAVEEAEKLQPESEAVRLWEGRASGFKLIHETETVKIFEVIE
jgi:dolichyl-diphosphooligosaccharide--protein glycosyltransferase